MKKRRSVEKLWPFIREIPPVEIKRGFEPRASSGYERKERSQKGEGRGQGAGKASDKGTEKVRVS